ncbi:hypothetical protein SAMN05421509_1212 [Chromohalobacter canadensis]|uniref:Uncharacterized protein n=1 Tax=Chromohalobacter canadensis TaxID=141389 RepID=A0A285VYM9_9GAMM|nr:hypothetical protein SAMN05421509_1212 [Chromohalobacter canadensis]
MLKKQGKYLIQFLLYAFISLAVDNSNVIAISIFFCAYDLIKHCLYV